ncbi:DUF4127 family protein [Coriobacteriales bacterium OH1046]|nr:DUF4127 family protein [Coriobacteriales bacterium OH1046]
MKLAILPLDSRPCTYDFPVQLALSGGLEPCVPPLELMDWYRRPSDFCRISAWLEEACADAQALICSLDQLAYGGLLASRTMGMPEEQALRQVGLLQALKERNPALDIYLSSVIMRTTVSTLCQEDLIWWEKVAQYSQLSAQTCLEARHQMAQLEQQIPTRVLQDFLSARKRNHHINREAIRLLSEGIVKEVCFLQEDSSPLGMHRMEQEELKELSASRCVSRHISIHCGTDEYACAIAGRLAAQRDQPAEPALRLYVEWLAGDEQFTAAYEDRPFTQNLESYLGTCHIEQVDQLEDAQAILAIYAPDDGQRDLAIAPDDALCTYTPDQLGRILRRLGALLDTGIPVGLLDIYFAGGGEGRLLRLAAQRELISRLAAYAGWNTACNSLGTILGQLQAARSSAASGQLRAFTRERLLDDWVYQAVVRPRWNRELRAEGIDVWNLPDIDAANIRLGQLMEAAPETRLVWPGKIRAQLRWPRTFEVRIALGEDVR